MDSTESSEVSTADSAIDRASDDAPTGFMPRVLCLWACALWLGAACASVSPWSAPVLMSAAADIGPPLLLATVLMSALIVVLVVVACQLRCIKAIERASLTVLLIASVCAGGGLRFAQTVQEASLPQLIVATDGQLVTIEATIASGFTHRGFAVDILSRHFDKPDRFQCRVEQVVFIGDDGSRVPLANAGEHSSADEIASDAALLVSVLEKPPAFGVTDRVRIVGRLYGLSDSQNPGGGDYRMFAARRRIVGSVSVESASLCVKVADYRTPTPFAESFARMREALRSRLRDALLAGVPDDETHAVRSTLVALVLGDTEEGYAAIENAFRAVGLAHILAISGFNLAVLGWIVAWTASLCLRDERWRAVPVALAAIAALWLMAPAASATRSALMAICGAMGASCERDWNGDAILALAAAIMILNEPSVATNAGFQLSFMCVLALRHLAPVVRARWLFWMPSDSAWRKGSALTGLLGEFSSRALAAGIATFLASAPVALAHFGTVQPYGLALTLLCAPLSTATLAIAYPKAILGLVWPPLVSIVGPVLWLPTWLQIRFVDSSLSCVGGSWSVGVTPVLTSIGLLILIVLMLYGTARWGRVLALCAATAWCTGFVLHARASRVRPHFTSTMIALGDGSMHFMETADAIVLFDAGSSSMGGVGTRVALPWISARGGVVDTLFISHPNLDHFSAALDIARYATVRRVMVHDSFLESAREGTSMRELLDGLEACGTVVESIGAGASVRIGNAQWQVLWPAVGFRSKRENDLSLVIRVDVDAVDESTRGARFLFTGDIETEPAARLVAQARDGTVDLACDVFELPHHGSWREAVVPLIAAANPLIVLQSTAQKRFDADRYAPHLPVDTQRFVTCRDGAVEVRVEASIDAGAGRAHLVSSTFDPDALNFWRSAGRRRLRPLVRPLVRPFVRLGCKRTRTSFATRTVIWRDDECGTFNDDAVADRAVRAVVESNRQKSALRRRRWYRDLHATSLCVESELLRRFTEHFNAHSNASVGWRWFGKDKFTAKDGALSAIDDIARKDERRGDRPVKGDVCASEEEAIGLRDSNRLRGAVTKRLCGDGGLECLAVGEGEEVVSLEDHCDGVSGSVVSRGTWSNALEPVGCEQETPTRGLVETNVASTDNRTVDGPHIGAQALRDGNICESKSRHAFHRNVAIALCGIGWRHSVVGRALDWLRRLACFCCDRLLCSFNRREHDIVTERLDKAAHCVTVKQDESVAIQLSNDGSVCDHLNGSDAVDVRADCADPSMFPNRLAVDDAKGPGQSLPVGRGEDPEREGSAHRQCALEWSGGGCLPSGGCCAQRCCVCNATTRSVDLGNEKRDHVRSSNENRFRVHWLSGDQRPVVLVERLESANDPLTVGLEDLDDGSVTDNKSCRRSCDASAVSVETDCAGGRGEQWTEPSARADECASEDPNGFGGRCGRHITHWVSRSESLALLSTLEDWQVSLRHLENDQSHRRSIRIPKLLIRPRAVGILPRQQLFSNRRPPRLPAFSAGEIHSLHGVILPIEIVGLREAAAKRSSARKCVLHEVVESALDRLIFVNARVKQARDASRGTWPRRATDILHVSEPAVIVLARTNISNRVINRRLRDFDARIARAAKRHHFADGHGDIGVGGDGVVAPSTLIVLTTHDQLDGASQSIADAIVVGVHPINLAEEERGESMSVHRPVRFVRDKQPCLGRVRENEVECLTDVVAEVAAPGKVAVSHERDSRETRDANVLAKAPLPKRTVCLLLTAQELEASLDRLFEFDGDLLSRRSILRTAVLQLFRRRHDGGWGIRARLKRRCRGCGRWCRRDGCAHCAAAALARSRILIQLNSKERNWCTNRVTQWVAFRGRSAWNTRPFNCARRIEEKCEEHATVRGKHHNRVMRTREGATCRMTRGPPFGWSRPARRIRDHKVLGFEICGPEVRGLMVDGLKILGLKIQGLLRGPLEEGEAPGQMAAVVGTENTKSEFISRSLSCCCRSVGDHCFAYSLSRHLIYIQTLMRSCTDVYVDRRVARRRNTLVQGCAVACNKETEHESW